MRVKLGFLLAYVIIISALFFMPEWRALDWHLFSALHQSAPPRWDDHLAIVDVPYLNEDGRFSLVQYRSKVGALMTHLASARQGRPAAVLFDISFGREVEGIEYLTRGLQALTSSNIRVYAAIDPFAKPASSTNLSSLSEPLRLVTGVGHTLFQRRGGVLVYR